MQIDGYSAIIEAVTKSHSKIVDALIEAGAEIILVYPNKTTVLLAAALKGNTKKF
jgi:ankyrin repeat protein